MTGVQTCALPIFRATTEERDVAVGATRDLLSRVFNSSVSGLVAHLLQHEKISDDEMAQLKQLLRDAEKKS